MKKTLIAALGILCLAAMLLGYHLSYPIGADQSNLEPSIQQWLNRGNTTDYTYSIKLHPSITLGQRTYIPMELGEELGYICLEKGVTGRYKITHSSHGAVDFFNGIVTVGGEKQLLFMGRNSLGVLSSAQFTPDANHTYEIAVPKQPVFFVHTPVDESTSTGPISMEHIALFNREGQAVASQLATGSGSIQ